MQQVERFYAAALARGYAIALWRQPGVLEPLGVASSVAQEIDQVDFSDDRGGFVLAPFSEQRPGLFIPAQYLCDSTAVYTEAGLPPLDLQEGADDANGWHSAPDSPETALDAAAYEALVTDAVSFIRSTQIAKVVVSRTAPVSLPTGFAPIRFFATLCDRYRDAFVSLVTVPGVGAWLGASPELLLSEDDSGISTVALAGTQPLPAHGSLQEVRWGAKERAEQEMVSTYIRSVFVESGAIHVDERGPTTVAAGSVVHLQTRFSFATGEDAVAGLANRVLAKLHPTSAVCGMPRNKALQFIQAREGYDRGFYSGYLGPLNIEGRSTLFVNLRCMQVRTETAALYVGAGITGDSDPIAEWDETELKARTILDALHDTGDSVPQTGITAAPTAQLAAVHA